MCTVSLLDSHSNISAPSLDENPLVRNVLFIIQQMEGLFSMLSLKSPSYSGIKLGPMVGGGGGKVLVRWYSTQVLVFITCQNTSSYNII